MLKTGIYFAGKTKFILLSPAHEKGFFFLVLMTSTEYDDLHQMSGPLFSFSCSAYQDATKFTST
jgi:hypothetical protein